MGKSHYKLLEIMARGKRFFKLFTEYFEEYEDLFPESQHVDPDFILFIEKTILDRLSVKLTGELIGTSEYLDNKLRDGEIEKNMRLLKKNKFTKDLHDLILEFDRWNNHRILPDSLQELSAFKRRNKTKEKNRLKLVSNLPPMVVDIIVNQLSIKTGMGRGKILWLPIIDNRLPDKKLILRIDSSRSVEVANINYMGLYLFRNYNDALEYIELVKDFLFSDEQSCKKGFVFWPKFRVISAKAKNHNKLQNIKVNRNYFERMVGISDRELVRRNEEGPRKKRKKRAI